MSGNLQARIREITGTEAERLAPLGGGCIGDVYRVDLAGGGRLVAKTGAAGSGLALEGYMLERLAALSELPVPEVVHAEDTLLLMSFIETSGHLNGSAQAHAAKLLAALHDVTADAYGFDQGSLSGGLDKPAPWTESWVEFFREHRLRFTAKAALDSGNLPRELAPRIEKLAGKVDRVLVEPDRPSLIHGDMWTGNVLCLNGRVAAFVDPSCYYAHAEQELAYSTLFGTFGKPFFRRYHEIRPIQPGFFEERLHLYNLYHLLIHVRLFGGTYVQATADTLRYYGF